MHVMSGKCEGIEDCRGQLGDCIDSLNHAQQLLFNGHVISDYNSFAKSVGKIRGAIAELSHVIVAASSSSEMIDLTREVSKDGDVDEFDSMLCDMDDEEFDMAVNTQPPTSSDVSAHDEGPCDQDTFTSDIPSPCQQHVDKLKQVFGHSQFKP